MKFTKLKKLAALVIAGAMMAPSMPVMASVTLDNDALGGTIIGVSATPASADTLTAAIPYTADMSTWIDAGDVIGNVTYTLTSAIDESFNDITASGDVVVSGSSLSYTPDAAQAGLDVDIVITIVDDDDNIPDTVTVTVAVDAVPANGGSGSGGAGLPSDTTVTEEGTIDYVDISPKYVVTVPTNNSLGFTVDPQGLLALESGDSVVRDEIVTVGDIVPKTGSGAFVKNESSEAIVVSVKMAVEFEDKDGTALTNVTLVNALEDVYEEDVTTSSDLNMLLLAIPGNDKIEAIADYEASDVGIAIEGLNAANTTDFAFYLDAATYAITNNGTNYEYGIVVDSDNYDSASFRLGGYVNGNGDWSDYAKATDPSTIGVKAVFKFTAAAPADEADDTYSAYGLMTLGSGVETVEVTAGESGGSGGTGGNTATNTATGTLAAGVTLTFNLDSGATLAKGGLANAEYLLISNAIQSYNYQALSSTNYASRVTISKTGDVVTMTLAPTALTIAVPKAILLAGECTFTVQDTAGKDYTVTATIS